MFLHQKNPPPPPLCAGFESRQTGSGLPVLSWSCCMMSRHKFTCACTGVWDAPRAASATGSFPCAGHGWWRSPLGGSWCRSSGLSSSYSRGSWSRTRSPSVSKGNRSNSQMMSFWCMCSFGLNPFGMVMSTGSDRICGCHKSIMQRIISTVTLLASLLRNLTTTDVLQQGQRAKSKHSHTRASAALSHSE